MSKFITVDTKDIKALELSLEYINQKGLGFANKWAVNTAVRAVQKVAQKKVKQDFILRKQWAVKSIQFEPTKSPKLSQQAAYVGSVADFMADQEFGSVKKSKRGKNVVLPTSYAAGQSAKSKPRLRLPRKANKLENIKLRNKNIKLRGSNQSAKRRSVVAVRMALRKKEKFVYLDLPWKKGKRGIFRVLSRKTNGSNLKMVHSLKEKSVVIPKSPWLKPSVDRVVPKLPRVYIKALKFQINKALEIRGLK